MFRVVIDVTRVAGQREFDRGPWLRSRDDAELWAQQLAEQGYRVYVEGLSARGELTTGKGFAVL